MNNLRSLRRATKALSDWRKTWVSTITSRTTFFHAADSKQKNLVCTGGNCVCCVLRQSEVWRPRALGRWWALCVWLGTWRKSPERMSWMPPKGAS